VEHDKPKDQKKKAKPNVIIIEKSKIESPEKSKTR